MDEIIVLAAGRVIERGTFQSLLTRNGPFAHMARQQGITTNPGRQRAMLAGA
jgi:ABC-type multidrug transport system fused ATPase/permease subunit